MISSCIFTSLHLLLRLILASYLEMPVSTTHSTVGGIIGMTMMCRSSSCVIWYEKTDSFPYFGGVAAIVISWALSPVASGLAAAFLYALTYNCVLRWKENSFLLSKIFFPFVVAFTIGLNVVFIVLKGASGQKEFLGTEQMIDEAKHGNMSKVLQVGAIAGAIAFVITAAAIPFLSKRVEKSALELMKEMDEKDDKKQTGELVEQPVVVTAGAGGTNVPYGLSSDHDHVVDDAANVHPEASTHDSVLTMVTSVTRALDADPYASLKTNKTVGDMHKNVERHDVKTEEMFKYVQVFTAVLDAFSHGANDVANAMGPFAAVYITHKNGYVTDEDDVGYDM